MPFPLAQMIEERLTRQQVILLPPQVFFVMPLEVPEELPAGEWANFAELSLESAAPFPLDQLLWGFSREPEQRRLLVYAAPRPRVKKLGLDDLDDAFFAWPGFLMPGLPTMEQAGVRFIAQSGGIAAVHYDGKSRVPLKITARPIAADILTDEAILAARHSLAKALTGLPSGTRVEDGIWVGEGVSVEGDQAVRARYRHLSGKGEGETVEPLVRFSSAQAWELDLRDTAFADKTRRDRRLGRGIWWGYLAAAARV